MNNFLIFEIYSDCTTLICNGNCVSWIFDALKFRSRENLEVVRKNLLEKAFCVGQLLKPLCFLEGKDFWGKRQQKLCILNKL